MNAVDGQGGKTAWELADEVKDAGKKEAVLAVLSEYSLHAAANTGNLESVKALITKGHDVNAEGGQRGETPSHLAAKGRHGEALKLVVAAGADVNGKDHERKTPLHSAAIAGSEAACRVLLEHGAEVNAQDQVMRGRGAWESMDVR